MIEYAICAAKESGLFSHIVVSTDNEEIAQLARGLNVETPFVRPSELADDYTATVPVIAHAIQSCLALGWKFEKVCCIYPCVPFIQIEDLSGALALINNSDVDYSFPVTAYPSAIQRALKLLSNGKVQPLYPEFELTRTQDLESACYDAGQFYWGKVDAWIKNPKIYCNGLGYVIPNWRVVDVDTPEDWQRAELIYRSIINNTTAL
jgi:pseudaminic acid cytidylyltransferase